MDWAGLWARLFWTTTLLGLDMGFWAALGAVALVVAAMGAAFWTLAVPKGPKGGVGRADRAAGENPGLPSPRRFARPVGGAGADGCRRLPGAVG